MGNNIKKVILFVLMISAIVLGFSVYKKMPLEVDNSPVNSNSPEKIDPNSFSADEIKLLRPPGTEASQEEVKTHSQLAAKLAVAGSEILVADCKSKPLVLQANLSKSMIFKNNGKTDLVITFDSQDIFHVNAGKSVSAIGAFKHGPGLYGYLCQSGTFKGLVGFILVAP